MIRLSWPWRLLAVVALSTSALFPALPAGSPTAVAAPVDPNVIPGQYIVVLRDDIVGAADLSAQVEAAADATVTHVYNHALHGFAAELSDEAVANIAADPRVAEIVPDRKIYPFAQTLTAGADRVDADLSPTADIDGRDQRVNADIAILDMGVGPHADINVAGGYDCTGSGTLIDAGGHGTHVAGIAAAKDNGFGIVGVAPGARIWSVKVLGAFSGSWSWVICGVDWVTAHADVIDVANMSLGEAIGANNTPFDSPLQQAIRRSVAAGVTYAVAAGNGSRDAANVIPARYDEVITVSAIGDSDGKRGGRGPRLSASRDDHLAGFSDFGHDVDIAAPGVDTFSTAPGGGYSVMSGTSFAAPHVAGAAALVVAAQGRIGPKAVRATLLAAAEPGPIPGDPDDYPEGVLNVAGIGGGSIKLSRSSGVPGDTVQITLSGFKPSVEVVLAWDFANRLPAVTDAAGNASVPWKIPASAKGLHIVTAVSAGAFAAATFNVKPVIRPSPASGPVGQAVKVILRGFAAGEIIDLFWQNGASTTRRATVTASGSGTVNASISVPSSLGGKHTLTADGRNGSLVRATFVVMPTLSRNPTSGPPGTSVRLWLRGFQAGESVKITLTHGGGKTTLTTTMTSSANGSRDVTVKIPVGALPGGATLTATGNKGTVVNRTFTVREPPPTSASVSPTPTPIATAFPEAETPAAETDTPEATPTETFTATPEPTVTATPIPTETPTATPTEPNATETAAPEPTSVTPEA